jgi:diaminopimelate epimerase
VTRFAKAHACGNDFLIVEGECDRELAVRLCARHTGVGADGVEFLEWTGDASGRIRLANADGSIAEISGNGTRCVAAWMAWQKAMAAAWWRLKPMPDRGAAR